MLGLTNKKKLASIIVGKISPEKSKIKEDFVQKIGMPDEEKPFNFPEEEGGDSVALESAMDDLLAALGQKDVAGAVRALREFLAINSTIPEDETTDSIDD